MRLDMPPAGPFSFLQAFEVTGSQHLPLCVTNALRDSSRVDGDPAQGLLCPGPLRDLGCLEVRVPRLNES